MSRFERAQLAKQHMAEELYSWSPWAPVAPWAPTGPMRPKGPVGPIGPVGLMIPWAPWALGRRADAGQGADDLGSPDGG